MMKIRPAGLRTAILLLPVLFASGCNRIVRFDVQAPEVVFYRTGAAKPSGIQPVDKDGKPVEAAKAKWSAEDPKVATVSDMGEVTPVAAGETKVHAKAGKAEAVINVRVVPLSKIDVAPETVNLVGPGGTTAMVEATPKDSKGVRVDAKFKWASSNPAVATVDGNGVVTSKSSGVTTAVVSIETVKTEVPVRVDIRELARIAIHPTTAILRPGEKQVFLATAFDAMDKAIPNVPVGWKSTDPGVCTVDPSGVVEGLVGGTCRIQASFAGRVAESSVIVNAR
jgi:uncharacterized protein YjdB